MEIHMLESNFKNHLLCRVCLARNENMQALFEDSSIIQQIEYCTGLLLTQEQNLPSHICHSCLTNLHTAHSFKATCLSSHYTLHSQTQHADAFPDNTSELIVKIERDDCKEMVGVGPSNSWGKGKKNKRAKLKDEDSPPDLKPAKVYKRGPYKKSPRSPRRPKFKFRRLFCTTCQIKFTSKDESDAHNAAVHPAKDAEAWMCEHCGKVFAHRGSHYTHVLSHQSPQHRCSECDYRTHYRHDLVKHLRIHAGVKQYQCAICAHSFHTSSNLTSHTRRLHARERPFACAQCPRRFFDRTKLRRHLDSHMDVKRFECEVCHSCFTRRCYWKKHLLKQHGITIPPQRPGRQKTNFVIGEEKEKVVYDVKQKTELIDADEIERGEKSA